MSVVDDYVYGPMVGDPDDHRPNTSWAFVFDPPREDGPYVADITCLFERIAPGDAIPLHTHTTSEVVVVDEGTGTYRLGEDTTAVRGGSVIFIPAGVPHGTVNDGTAPLRIHAMYPSRVLDFTYLERNPAPGTEGDPPQPPTVTDPRVDTI
jgi:mannose-6-phosphate isomerase-like protein (cupin superfamily)